MKRAIVTGASGFVGRHLVQELITNDIDVIAVVKDENSNISDLKKSSSVCIVYCDLDHMRELPSTIQDRNAEVFFHLAWEGSSGDYRTNERLQMKNALSTVDALKACSELGCKRFVGAGSIMEKEAIYAVYAQRNRPGKSYIYGMGKLAAHMASKSFAASMGIEHLWGLITNAYGPGELSPRFVNTTLRRVLRGEPLKFTSATQNYDFIFVTDVAKAFVSIGTNGIPFKNYTIGSSKPAPLRSFICQMLQVTGTDISPQFGDIPFKGVDLPTKEFSTVDLEQDTGFKSEVTFSEGIRRTLDWLRGLEE